MKMYLRILSWVHSLMYLFNLHSHETGNEVLNLKYVFLRPTEVMFFTKWLSSFLQLKYF